MTQNPDAGRPQAADGAASVFSPILWLVPVVLAFACVLPGPARAQYAPNLFPAGVPGYGEELGVTVVSRLHPLYAEEGVHVGAFTLRLNLDESVGYNSNVLGLSDGKGSTVVRTSPSVSIHSDWSRNALGMSFGVDDYRYPGLTTQNHTDWTAAIGGGYTIGQTNLTIAYAHLSRHENATSIGAPASTTPIPYTIDDMRIAYPFRLGALTITPNFESSLWRYGNAVIGGTVTDQGFRNSNQYRGGVAFDYALWHGTSAVVTLQAIRSAYVTQPAGAPSLSSTSGIILGGIDYQYDGVWRYQALAGVEVRAFDAVAFSTKVAPIARGTVIWTPTGLTTITASVLRAIEDPTTAGNSGYAYNSASVRIDHEYQPNLLLHAQIGGELISYLQGGGTQRAITAGLGASWLINRHMRLSADYAYTTRNDFSSAPVNGGPVTPALQTGFDQNLFLVSMHFGL